MCAHTAGVEGEQSLLPQDTMPTRNQTPSLWHTREPPQSPCREEENLTVSLKGVLRSRVSGLSRGRERAEG